MSVLLFMFCLGMFSVFAQMLFLREMLIVFFGNELSIGAILGSWLSGIGLGAFCSRLLLRRARRAPSLRRLCAALAVGLACLLPGQVYLVRIVRSLLHVPLGEYAPFGAVLLSALAVFLPTCLSIGFVFPCACQLLASDRRWGEQAAEQATGLVYALEATGSMLGGVLLSFVLLPRLSPLRMVALAQGVACLAAVMAAPGRATRRLIAVLAIAPFVAGLCPACLRGIEQRTAEARWRAFGVLPPAAGRPAAVRLVRSVDSVYQNLALTESYGQYALYGNGQVAFVFPDKAQYEEAVHFVMAQKPTAQTVLVLGGNPAGLVPELLKYPLRRVVHVALDPREMELLESVVPETCAALGRDPRVRLVAEDGPRFVRRCRATFDVVLINAPNPTSAALNRYYTREFFLDVRRVLGPAGFVYTAVSSSERLQSEATDLAASVFHTLRAVFPVVRVTAESVNRFFAGPAEAGLTFDRDTLFARSRAVGMTNDYFRPEFFLGTDVIEPDKTAFVEGRFSDVAPQLNTSLRPVTYFYNLVLWSRYSGSGLEPLLHGLRRVRASVLAGGLLAAGGLVGLAGVMLGRRNAAGGAAGRRWLRVMTGLVVASTGFCAMALEIVLVFVFQNLYGYVYTRMGLIVAVFMLGLVVGAPSGRTLARRWPGRAWRAMLAFELVLAVFPLAVLLLVRLAAGPATAAWAPAAAEPVFYLAVACLGWLTGAQFPLANRLFCDAGGHVGAAAAATDAADHIGAALGSLLVGVLFVPVLGTGPACLVLAALKAASLLCLISGMVVLRRGGTSSNGLPLSPSAFTAPRR
ncbi:MAG: hypothetical protein JXR37_21590 [Kiritimatiellae bacterium]|nr:hypothetical protein [Kiritimatiellia bacterium]